MPALARSSRRSRAAAAVRVPVIAKALIPLFLTLTPLMGLVVPDAHASELDAAAAARGDAADDTTGDAADAAAVASRSDAEGDATATSRPMHDLLVICSDRSAARWVAAAHATADREEGVRVAVRSATQLDAMDDAQLAALLDDATAIVLTGLWGTTADRLLQTDRLRHTGPPGRSTADAAGDRHTGPPGRSTADAAGDRHAETPGRSTADAAGDRHAEPPGRSTADAAGDRRAEPAGGGGPVLALHADQRLVLASSWGGRRPLEALPADVLHAMTTDLGQRRDWLPRVTALLVQHPGVAPWLLLRAHVLTRDTSALADGLLQVIGAQAPRPPDAAPSAWSERRFGARPPVPWRARRDVAVLTLDGGDAAFAAAVCRAMRGPAQGCRLIEAGWGEATADALEALADGPRPVVVVNLQDFVPGGGSARERAERALDRLDVPVVHPLVLDDTTVDEWEASAWGLRPGSIHYRVTMPEVAGQLLGEPIGFATAGHADPRTGAHVPGLALHAPTMARLAERAWRWRRLQDTPREALRVALVLYNHPPGRQNIGADGLDVPRSVVAILRALDGAGIDIGNHPLDPDALVEALLDHGFNAPSDPVLLQRIARRAVVWPTWRWAERLATLPDAAREALEAAPPAGWGPAPGTVMVDGDRFVFPGFVDGNVFVGPQPPRGWEQDEATLHANTTFAPSHQYGAFYTWLRDEFRADAIIHLGRHSTLEFLPGRSVGLGPGDFSWELSGAIPVLYPYIVDGLGEGLQAKRRGQAVIIDHLTPPMATRPLYDRLLALRELVESWEAAHANAVPDDAAAAVAWLRILELVDELGLESAILAELAEEHAVTARAIRAVAPELVVHEIGHQLSDMQETFAPLGLHVFGERWQDDAVAMMVRSMLATSDRGSTEAGAGAGAGAAPGDDDTSARARALATLLLDSADAELAALLRGLSGGRVLPGVGNDPLRTADVLPTGRNFHGIDDSRVPTIIAWDLALDLHARAGRSPAAAAGDRATNQPGRSPAAAAGDRATNPPGRSAAAAAGDRRGVMVAPAGTDAVTLWASDTVSDGGVMVAFALRKLGVRPVWDARNRVVGLERMPLEEVGYRSDVLLVTSGIFRDLFAPQLELCHDAVLVALAGSGLTIRREHPSLAVALDAALGSSTRAVGGVAMMDGVTPLAESDEPLARNAVARHWVEDTLAAVRSGTERSLAGAQAIVRVYGNAPGGYGAGVNTLADRPAAWTHPDELADVFELRMAHAWGGGRAGESARDLFTTHLRRTERSWHGRASHLYGVLDNNDGFDFLGGLSLAVTRARGAPPSTMVLTHTNPQLPRVETLEAAIARELHARHLHPDTLRALAAHGYSGARTLTTGFIDNLWGWQVTAPHLVTGAMWQAVFDALHEDRHGVGMDAFLGTDATLPARIHLTAVLLEAARREYWEPSDDALRDLRERFATDVVRAGLPGSGHTARHHALIDDVARSLSGEQRAAFRAAVLR